jgi:hypothetical protein
MSKIRKKYLEFIKEELTANPKLSDSELSSRVEGVGRKDNEEKLLILRSKFWNSIIDMTEDLTPRSFSDMCKKYSNPEEDWNEMQSLMDKKGWDIQSIKNLFSPKVDQICGYSIEDLVKGEKTDKFKSILTKLNTQGINTSILRNIEDPFRNPSLDQQNGHCDIYLYFTFKQLGLNPDFIRLGGEGWADYDGEDELFIRYSYGYHKTSYGKLMLKQIGMSEEEFANKALVNLESHIDENMYDIFFGGGFGKEVTTFMRDAKLKDFSIIEDDRFVVYVHEISDYINKELKDRGSNKSYKGEDVVAAFTKYLDKLGLKMYFTGDELVILSKIGAE